MYNTIFSIYGNFLNLTGTIVAVLCVIKIRFKDLSVSGSITKLSHPEVDSLKQRRFALKGISIIFMGFIITSICALIEIDVIVFTVIIVVSLILICITSIYFNWEHDALLQEFDKYMTKQGKKSPLDDAVNGNIIRNKKIPLKFNVEKYMKD